jgi:Trk K+ transport system NAD-binding subunit
MDELLIAEATAAGTPLLGKTMTETRLRELVGVTVIGMWERGVFKEAGPETVVTDKTVLVLAGSAEQLHKYDELFCIYHVSGEPVVIIGGGRVGQATGRALAQRRVDFRIVEREAVQVRSMEEKTIIGDAAELEVLDRAGLMKAPAVIITTHDDNTNIYLTLYCRKLRPDIQIISRATEDRNVTTMHRAGADFVISYASMGASIIFNYLKRSDILVVAEGLSIVRMGVPAALVGKSLAGAALREQTGCHVIAVGADGEMRVNPDPTMPLQAGQEIVVAGNAEAEERFFEKYGTGTS